MNDSEPIFGLDVGTSKCCAGAVDPAGWPRILADAAGKKVIPSVVSFHPDGNVLVGDEAKARRTEDSANTVASVTRLAGLRASSREVVDLASRSPYTFRVGANDAPLIGTRAGDLGIPDLLGILMDHMRRLAAAALDADARRCVLTVPAFYDQKQREAVRAAAKIAGLTVEGLLDDPVAAALAYAYSRATQPIVAVYDFGGGKFECTILEVKGDDARVLGTFGDTFLGGDDVDARVADYTVRAFWQVHRVDLRADPAAPPRLLEAAERAKWDLSAKPETQLAVPNIGKNAAGKPLDLSLTLSREIFAQATDDIVKRTFAVCTQACARAGVAPAQIDEVLLLGGMTKLPWVRDAVAAHFGKQPRTDVNPDVGVALGATLWGARVADHREVRPNDDQAGEQGAVSASDSPPGSQGIKKRVTSQFGSDTQQTQPSAAVARTGTTGERARVGRINTKKMFTAAMAAVPEAAFGPTTPVGPVAPVAPQLAEVMAASLAISTVGGYCEPLIAKEAVLPAEKTRVFSTGKDGQRVVKIAVCQGDSRRFADNVPLGTLVLDGLPARPRGNVKIAVSFAIDTEGVLVAGARDEETGRAQSVRIQLRDGEP